MDLLSSNSSHFYIFDMGKVIQSLMRIGHIINGPFQLYFD